METKKTVAVQGSNPLSRRMRDNNVMNDLFVQTINGVCFQIGITKKLTRFEHNIVYNFIHNEFANLTLEGIVEAFTKWSARKLEYKNSHYDKFDNHFIGGVLNSYDLFMQKERCKTSIQKPPEEYKRQPYTNDVGKTSYEFIKKIFDKDGKEPFLADYNFAWKYMIAEKIIELNDSEKEAIKNAVRMMLLDEKKERREKRRTTSDIDQKLNDDKAIQYECKKMAIIEHFKDLDKF